jgi:hypothetical protein
MSYKLLVTLAAGLLSLTTGSLALGAEIAGTVADKLAKPVAGAQVSVQDAMGKRIASATSNSQGHYQTAELEPGRYDCILDAHTAGLKGGRVSAGLGDKGLTINWTASPGTAAIAETSVGITQQTVAGDPLGLSPATFGAAVAGSTLAVAGGVIGGYFAAGGFSSSSSSSTGPSVGPASPSL